MFGTATETIPHFIGCKIPESDDDFCKLFLQIPVGRRLQCLVFDSPSPKAIGPPAPTNHLPFLHHGDDRADGNAPRRKARNRIEIGNNQKIAVLFLIGMHTSFGLSCLNFPSTNSKLSTPCTRIRIPGRSTKERLVWSMPNHPIPQAPTLKRVVGQFVL